MAVGVLGNGSQAHGVVEGVQFEFELGAVGQNEDWGCGVAGEVGCGDVVVVVVT